MILTILLWSLFGLSLFVFALAMQMRFLLTFSLMKALQAHIPELDIAQSRQAVLQAFKGETKEKGAQYIQQTYPKQIDYMQRARLFSRIMPLATLLILLTMKYIGVI